MMDGTKNCLVWYCTIFFGASCRSVTPWSEKNSDGRQPARTSIWFFQTMDPQTCMELLRSKNVHESHKIKQLTLIFFAGIYRPCPLQLGKFKILMLRQACPSFRRRKNISILSFLTYIIFQIISAIWLLQILFEK